MEIAALNLAIGHYFQHIRIIAQVPCCTSLFCQVFYFLYLGRFAFCSIENIITIYCIMFLSPRKQILTMVCQSDIIFSLNKSIFICNCQVFYRLIVILSKHNYRSATIVVKYRIGRIPAMKLRKANKCIRIIRLFKIIDTRGEQRSFCLRIFLRIQRFFVLSRYVAHINH